MELFLLYLKIQGRKGTFLSLSKHILSLNIIYSFHHHDFPSCEKCNKLSFFRDNLYNDLFIGGEYNALNWGLSLESWDLWKSSLSPFCTMPAENTVLETFPAASVLCSCPGCAAACSRPWAPSETSQPCSGLKSPQVTQPKVHQRETNSPERWQPHEVQDSQSTFKFSNKS